MALPGQRMARVSGWTGAAVLAACVALTVTVPSSAASEARASAGPSGVQAKAAAIAAARASTCCCARSGYARHRYAVLTHTVSNKRS
jgi:hypothetical protein